MIRISDRWTKTAKTPVSMTPPPENPQKAKFTLGVKMAPFLFRTASMASNTVNYKGP